MTNYLQHRLQLKNGDKPAPEKKVYKIAPQSKKRQQEQRVYVAIVKAMMQESNLCELKVAGVCHTYASGCHHQKKRIGFLLDKRYLKRACNACNQFAEQFPLKSIDLGISLSKFTK
jgi:hypothetical protein